MNNAEIGNVKASTALIVDDKTEISITDGLSINFAESKIEGDLTINFRGGEERIADRFVNTKISGGSIKNLQGLQFTPPPTAGSIYKPLVLTYSQAIFIRSFFQRVL